MARPKRLSGKEHTDIQVRIIYKVNELRVDRGLSQHTLAKKAGIHVSTIARNESLQNEGYSLSTLIEILNVFNIKLSDFFRELGL